MPMSLPFCTVRRTESSVKYYRNPRFKACNKRSFKILEFTKKFLSNLSSQSNAVRNLKSSHFLAVGIQVEVLFRRHPNVVAFYCLHLKHLAGTVFARSRWTTGGYIRCVRVWCEGVYERVLSPLVFRFHAAPKDPPLRRLQFPANFRFVYFLWLCSKYFHCSSFAFCMLVCLLASVAIIAI